VRGPIALGRTRSLRFLPTAAFSQFQAKGNLSSV